ncbi:MAG: hypothetical protein AB8B68_01975 [Rickettsiaceae bacterium]
MKTNNYQFDLMYQGQDHKDIVYNETILKLDANLNLCIEAFIENPPEDIVHGQRFIITSGESENRICYFAHKTKGVQYIVPHENMIVYIVKDNCFVRFSENNWQKIISISSAESISSVSKFTGIKDKFTLPDTGDCHYLYLEDNCTITFDNVDISSFAIIVKQHYEQVFEIKWPENILWPNKKPKQITAISNSIDFFKFYRIPESQHFLADLVKQNYQY